MYGNKFNFYCFDFNVPIQQWNSPGESVVALTDSMFAARIISGVYAMVQQPKYELFRRLPPRILRHRFVEEDGIVR